MQKLFYSNLSKKEVQFYKEWNRHTDSSTLNTLITKVFSEQAANNPQLPAIEYNNQQLSYNELETQSNQFALYLIEHHKTKEEDRIGIFMNPSLALPLTMLSVLKASAAFVPLDPNYPADRLTYMINDADLSIIVTTSDLLSQLPTTTCTIVQIDKIQTEREKYPTKSFNSGLKPSTLAYVIYTSGSTGRPKGVMVEHKGIVNMALAEASSYKVNSGDRVMQFASINFDGAICDIFMTLAVGGLLCLINNEDRNAGQALNTLINKKKINTVVLTPSVLSATPSTNLPDLKSIGSAGESCTPDIIKKWGNGRHFINSFGPTENTVVATAAEKEDCYPSITVGKPMPNVQVYTIDENNKQVGIGQIGEIAIAGIQVARGYLNQPDLTAERFIKDPLSDIPTALLYKTGDFGRINTDGNLEYIGRKDDQVKLRGQRIELGEIENVINKLTNVNQSVVILATTQSGDKRIVVYITGSTTTNQLREHIANLLPVHMMPNHFIFVDSLPTTPNGKVDKEALKSNALSQTNKVSGPAAKTSTEIKISKIWATLIEIDHVSTVDNFFELGGSSLLAVEALECINEKIGIEPDFKLLTLGTLKEVAHHCDELLEKHKNSWVSRFRKVLKFT